MVYTTVYDYYNFTCCLHVLAHFPVMNIAVVSQPYMYSFIFSFNFPALTTQRHMPRNKIKYLF